MALNPARTLDPASGSMASTGTAPQIKPSLTKLLRMRENTHRRRRVADPRTSFWLGSQHSLPHSLSIRLRSKADAISAAFVVDSSAVSGL